MSSGVSYLVVFCALALHLNPDERAIVMYGNDQAFERFVQEVRRFYPFAQGMGGIARKDIQWRGYAIPGKTLLILDLYGTNHDARTWPIRTCSARRGSSNGTEARTTSYPKAAATSKSAIGAPENGSPLNCLKSRFDF
jgi:hypothetical protein